MGGAGGGPSRGLGTDAAQRPGQRDRTGRRPGPPLAAQQLALARLLLSDPHTLVLDEATALLDSTASHRVERSLAALIEGRTVISIVHHLDSVRYTDHIAVMDHGRIVELGSHDKLLAAQGAYASLWHSWESARSDPPVREAFQAWIRTT
ncbi:hypothetical protein [Streptomyces sp. NRRL F-5065]|uniref:hypothetical protein n=1 Tax=Streptomyces sp. NRRL F-5065 TaxID=1463855 RepID=UPI0004BFB8E4|nr:hypothetical protein [Streptomyces sp. NRRL F-5065]